ncbi:MAG: DUF4912 domain-containing protein [Oscillospiraceae bacterium]|nr:DUF4912 domain-containing protein [Oscillospiraceae bacterium]
MAKKSTKDNLKNAVSKTAVTVAKKITKKSVPKTTKKVDKTSTKKTKKATAVKKVTKKVDKTTNKKINTETTKKVTKKPIDKVANKKVSSKTKKTATNSKKKTNKKFNLEDIEYYDIPYRYNETTVKLLAQTPTMLFVYWDISDKDIAQLKEKYGENFLEITTPVLLVHNETLNYNFYVTINDFANNWYVPVDDVSCVYKIQLGRVYKNSSNAEPNYIHVCFSNPIETPNNTVMLNKWNNSVNYKNIKNGKTFTKLFADKSLKLFYKEFFTDNSFWHNNPSSH